MKLNPVDISQRDARANNGSCAGPYLIPHSAREFCRGDFRQLAEGSRRNPSVAEGFFNRQICRLPRTAAVAVRKPR
jgi:hypothetical protein